jgi:hypothetical protein
MKINPGGAPKAGAAKGDIAKKNNFFEGQVAQQKAAAAAAKPKGVAPKGAAKAASKPAGKAAPPPKSAAKPAPKWQMQSAPPSTAGKQAASANSAPAAKSAPAKAGSAKAAPSKPKGPEVLLSLTFQVVRPGPAKTTQAPPSSENAMRAKAMFEKAAQDSAKPQTSKIPVEIPKGPAIVKEGYGKSQFEKKDGGGESFHSQYVAPEPTPRQVLKTSEADQSTERGPRSASTADASSSSQAAKPTPAPLKVSPGVLNSQASTRARARA